MKNDLRKKNRGQSLVELAIILPLLLMLICGIVEFGRIFNAYLIINNASRHGARCGAVGYSDAEIEEEVKGAASTLDQSRLTVSITPKYGSRSRGDSVSVIVGYSINIITPGINIMLPNPTYVESTTEMRVE